MQHNRQAAWREGHGMSMTTNLNWVHLAWLMFLPNTFKCEVANVCVLVTQSCPTLCDPMDCSPPGSSVNGILQARILEWAAIPFSRESAQPWDWTWIPDSLLSEPPGKPSSLKEVSKLSSYFLTILMAVILSLCLRNSSVWMYYRSVLVCLFFVFVFFFWLLVI